MTWGEPIRHAFVARHPVCKTAGINRAILGGDHEVCELSGCLEEASGAADTNSVLEFFECLKW